MLVALCLFGQPRQALKGYATFLELMQRNDEVEFDVFFHAWHDPAQTRYMASPWRRIPEEDLAVDPAIIDKLVHAYRPVSYLVEPPPVSFDLSRLKASPFWDASDARVQANIVNTLSQLHSRQKVRDLVLRHGRGYDMIIGSRFDFLRPLLLDLKALDPGKLYVSNMHVPRCIFPDNLVIANPCIFFRLFNAFCDLDAVLFSRPVVQLLGHVYGERPNVTTETILFATFLRHFGDVVGHVVYTPSIPDFW